MTSDEPIVVRRDEDGNPTITLAGWGDWQRRVHAEEVWGTVVTFDLRADAFPDDYDEIMADAIAYLHQVDRWFSTYKADTPISLLRNGILPDHRIPPVVSEVLDTCAWIKQLTNGVFDPWAVKGGVDPSGYVKGWAAGMVADQLVAAGIPNVCVNASGDVACRGFQAPGEGWAIGITNPYDTQQIVEVVTVFDGAIATSGLYERGEHITNPHMGTTKVEFDSATIVGPDAGLADALATACLIAGPSCAAWFAQLPDWSVYFIKDGQAMFFGPAFEHITNRD